ncbi:MAG: 30S ribosomal protein S4 [Candidatus Pacebacteria bacterium]|nr:30S ribosomal protein S4 [Candidatus Paceibacterota bacterium]
MKIGPRYKIARRLGGSVFDKTQTQKFAMRASARKEKAGKKKRAGSDFSLQLIEKQKARFTYGLGEKQFKNTIESILSKKSSNINESLVQALESRLDNVVYRLGLGKSRQATKQLVNHGHIDVNGKRVSIPSYKVSVGDVITIRERSKAKPIFKDLNEKLKEVRVPSWLSFDVDKKVAKVQGLPKIPANELAFDVSLIFQYYSR